MSDPNPMNRPTPDPTRGNVPPPVEPPPGEPRKGANPIVWIVVLVALLALAWYFMSRRDTVEAPPEPTAPIGQADGTPDAEPAPERTTPRPATPAATPPRPDRDAAVLASVEPEYPVAAARARDTGTVLVRAQVDAEGMPTDVEVARSSRSRELDRAAVDAVKQWTFEPAIRDGKAVASTVQVPVEFTLSQQ
ncbi:TonB family protein [Luteimonas aestuarii]|uniref:Protein TonB n=1 Tax=Luteimonas aestuarii TaxID=453837 RepID=A0A4R5U3P5_9GAMM|nr:energy transducer TonB [Luteimonas aestuarii]TDK28330.1 TonB family protein [Luteimonas aestuarii]